MTTKMEELWYKQKSYNKKVRASSLGTTPQDWLERYLLGLVAEIDEVLRETGYKLNHKVLKKRKEDNNLAMEVADLLKYVLSVADVLDIGLGELLDTAIDKSNMLDVQWNMDRCELHEKVLICDLDGTLADYRQTLFRWMNSMGLTLPVDTLQTMSMDLQYQMAYPDYDILKYQFEQSGMYGKLIPYRDSIQAVLDQQNQGISLLVFTARPLDDHKRIWYESYRWLQEYNIRPDVLRVGRETRLHHAVELIRDGHQVMLWDDDPVTIQRATLLGIHIFAKRFPYNDNINSTFVKYVSQYTDLDPEDYWEIVKGGIDGAH